MFASRLVRVTLLGFAIAVCAFAGCSRSADDFSSKQGFSDHLLANCLRSESEFNPRPMRLRALKEITGEPKAIADVDESTQRWEFEFDDGGMDVYVVLEPGASWLADSPKVFVDVQRSGLMR